MTLADYQQLDIMLKEVKNKIESLAGSEKGNPAGALWDASHYIARALQSNRRAYKYQDNDGQKD